MRQNDLIENIERTAAATWTPHPKFAGVAMKTLITGAMTGNTISQHLVRVDPGCALEPHVHATQGELHLVLAGNGKARLGDAGIDYGPGSVNAIPAGCEHSVLAGAGGLTLLASFSPPLA